jgi:tripartite-type tricarboxylate transporter receptor subunit TctC
MNRMNVARAFLGLLIAGCGAVSAAQAQTQPLDWPTRPIRAIIPLSPGSAADVVPRIVFEELSARLKQPIVVENRVGASGTIGAHAVAVAPPDGYTLLAHSSAHVIAPSTVANISYDPVRDFAAVAALGNLPNVLVVAPSSGIKTVQQFVALGKTRPITFGSIGVGSPIHLTMERFRQSAGFEAQAVQYRGAPEVLIEVMAGRIDTYYAPISAALPFIRAGKLVPLVVSSSARTSTLADVPTSLEAGYTNSDYNFWIGLFAPAKTPPAIVARLNAETNNALAAPTVKQKLGELGVEPMPMSVEAFSAMVKNDLAVNSQLAKAAGISPE